LLEYLLICVTALAASLLTFFSGFGLGTILLPVLALFFPIDIAIALTGIVHLLNNLFKLILVGKYAVLKVVLKFGLPAIVAAFAGAELLFTLTEIKSITSYTLGESIFFITPVKLIIAILMITFSILELLPKFKQLQFKENKLFIGGILSGFFGGLSGHQGALRSAFLIKLGLSKESFIATGVVIACLIDFTRLSVYFSKFVGTGVSDNLYLLTSATLSAFIGAYFGNKLLKKVTLDFIQTFVAVMIMMIAIGLGSGLI
jgi:uncharacterized protein